MAGGRVNKCKECNKKDVTDNRNKNIERFRAYDRRRGNRQTAEYHSKYREKFPNKCKAHSMVAYAISSKKLFSKNCEVCLSEKTHAHHDDYLEPLNIRWLCPPCHKKWHKENGEGKNG